jgi:hypothetical protein
MRHSADVSWSDTLRKPSLPFLAVLVLDYDRGFRSNKEFPVPRREKSARLRLYRRWNNACFDQRYVACPCVIIIAGF